MVRTCRASCSLLIALAAGLAASTAHGQILDLDSLKSVQRGLREAQRGVREQQIHHEARADSLSEAIYDLRRQKPRSSALQDALIRSMASWRTLGALSQQLHELNSKEAELRPTLRAAYDWEISRLFRELREYRDEGLLLQLVIYQEERKALGDEIVVSQMRYGEDMKLSEADGPDEIRQKIQLLEGMANRYRKRAEEIEQRISTLEEENQLARAIWESPSPTRRVAGHVAASTEVTEASHLLPEVAALPVGSAATATPVRGSRSTTSAAAAVRRELSSGSRATSTYIRELEIEQWKVQQREVAQIQAVLRERITAFRERLQLLLEDGE